MLGEVVYVGYRLDESRCIELLGNFLADSVDIHGMARHKVLDAPCYLRTAVIFVGTRPCGFPLDAHKCCATHRAGSHKLHRLAPGLSLLHIHPHYLGYYLTALLYIHEIAFVNVELAYYVLIVERCALHYCARQLHRLEICHRGDYAASSCLKRHEFQLRTLPLGGKLVCHSPAWRLGGESKVALLPQGIDFEHKSVGGYRQILPFRVPICDKTAHFVYRVQDLILPGLEPPLFHHFNIAGMGVAGQIFAKQEVEIGIEIALCHFG